MWYNYFEVIDMSNQQIVSVQEMRQLDELTLEQKNITSFELMDHVAKTIFQYVIEKQLVTSRDEIVIVAGTGNNGGDALLTGLHLVDYGLTPTFVVVGNRSKQSLENKQATRLIEQNNIVINWVEEESQVDHFTEMIDQATLIIDGIFGIGITKKVKGVQRLVISKINRSYATVISIDIPSGINADNGLVMKRAVKANHTIIIQNYKHGNVLNDALDYAGTSHLLDVGIIQKLSDEPHLLLPMSLLKNSFPKRIHNSYKYQFGNILTIGGAKGMMGAPLLSGIAALKTGSGLSMVSYYDKYLHHIQNMYPELQVTTHLGIEDIPSMVRKKNAIVFGPGLGKNDSINLEILSYLLSTDIPLVIDADGIYYLKELMKDYNERKNIIITPHYQEMASFLDVSVNDVKQEPVLLAKNMAHKYSLTVVLKGVCTIITNNEETYFSIHGNPGMATAGTGDVLSGIIGSLLGRGYNTLEAAQIGVLIHSEAGRLAMEEFGVESLTATDLISKIAPVIKENQNN
jgi:NAD(P)H-hydrate epimerase